MVVSPAEFVRILVGVVSVESRIKLLHEIHARHRIRAITNAAEKILYRVNVIAQCEIIRVSSVARYVKSREDRGMRGDGKCRGRESIIE